MVICRLYVWRCCEKWYRWNERRSLPWCAARSRDEGGGLAMWTHIPHWPREATSILTRCGISTLTQSEAINWVVSLFEIRLFPLWEGPPYFSYGWPCTTALMLRLSRESECFVFTHLAGVSLDIIWSIPWEVHITLHEESVCGSIGTPPKAAKVLREFSEHEERGLATSTKHQPAIYSSLNHYS